RRRGGNFLRASAPPRQTSRRSRHCLSVQLRCKGGYRRSISPRRSRRRGVNFPPRFCVTVVNGRLRRRSSPRRARRRGGNFLRVSVSLRLNITAKPSLSLCSTAVQGRLPPQYLTAEVAET